jgi:oligo-1,6-glucosidase
MDKSLSEAEKLEKVNFGSRDNVRHPMAWDGSAGNGFTAEGVKPWLAPHSRGSEVNLEADLASERSVCRFYRELLALRSSEDAFTDGAFRVISKPEDPYFVFTRTLGGESWAVVCNFEDEQEIKLPFECEAPSLSNLSREKMTGRYGPYECAAAKLISF